MQYLLDTGVLLRLLHRGADHHSEIRDAVRLLKSRKDACVIAFQNIVEFWNVCTRPVTARGGLGLTLEETNRRVRVLERIASLLPDSPDAYHHWKNLVVGRQVMGVKVHDARLVATMKAAGVDRIVTLNSADFSRYGEIHAVTPAELVASK